VAAILASPKTFMGAAVIDVSAAAGWNTETGNCQINLVEDPATPNATAFTPAAPGTAYVFTLGSLNFGGILQQWTESVSVGSGKTYSVVLNSPTTALEGAQVIMNSYEGIIPVHNVFNPFGARENYAYGGNFGRAFTNDAGYPWGLLLVDIQNLVNSVYAGGAFGGPGIKFGQTVFKIDLTELVQLAGGLYWYRVAGTHATILSVIRDICEAASADFMVDLVGGTPDAATGICTDSPTIKIKVLPRHTAPTLGVLSAYVNQAEADGILVSKSLGLELGDTTTSKMVFGGPQSKIWENLTSEFGSRLPPGKQIRPIWDIEKGIVTIGDHYDVDGKVLVRLPDGMFTNAGKFYICNILELRCAMTSKEAWESYAAQFNLTIRQLIQSNTNNTNLQSAAAPVNVILGNTTLQTAMQNRSATPFDLANTSSSAAKQWEIGEGKTIQEILDKIYNSVRRTADEYYGKKFLVAIPYEPGGFGNNVRFTSEDMNIISSWKIANSAWVEPKPIADLAFYDGDGKLKPYAVYPYGGDYDYSNISDNYIVHGLSFVVAGVPIGGSVVVRDITVEPEINWSFFISGGLPYAVCSVPKVSKKDKWSKKKGLEALYKDSPVGVITNSGPHSTGFGHDVTNFSIAQAAIMPIAVGVAMESTRRVYGPWFHQGGVGGRTEVEHDTSLRPETFGSIILMNNAGVTKAFATTLDLQNSESGEIEVAELPTVSLAEKIDVDGPYLSQISVSVSTSQITTKYTFETWTLNFGKIAKYNTDRISRINKNTMRFLQELRGQSKNPPLRAPGMGGGVDMNSRAGGGATQQRYGVSTSHMMVADYAKGNSTHNNVGMQPIGTTMSQINKDYQKKFAMSQDGMFRAFGTRLDRKGNPQIRVPYMLSSIPPTGLGDNDAVLGGSGNLKVLTPPNSGKFINHHIYPAMEDLNFVWSHGGLHDIQAIARDIHSPDLNIRKGGYAQTDYRGIGLRGPVVITGWGYDTDRNPVPMQPSGDGGMSASGIPVESGEWTRPAFSGYFIPKHMKRSDKWKTGPLETYWDNERKLWSTRWQMIQCRLLDDLKEGTLDNPSTAAAAVIAPSGANKDLVDTGEIIQLVNRDKGMSVNVQNSDFSNDLYGIAIYVGGEWRPIYMTCGRKDG
jgi:hypothetical protein